MISRDLQHRGAEPRGAGKVGVRAESLNQSIEEAQECAADETDQQVFFRRPVQVDGALADMGARCHIGDGEPLRAPADQQVAGGGQ